MNTRFKQGWISYYFIGLFIIILGGLMMILEQDRKWILLKYDLKKAKAIQMKEEQLLDCYFQSLKQEDFTSCQMEQMDHGVIILYGQGGKMKIKSKVDQPQDIAIIQGFSMDKY